MGYYKVKHPADKDCKDCKYFDLDIYEDSFGPVTDVNCKKGNYAHVDYYAEACKDFRDKED